MKIKICGITTPQDAAVALEEGADFLGFIFNRGPRQADARVVREIVRRIPRHAEGVGVFTDQPFDEVRSVLEQSDLTIAQLHGAEPPEYAAALGVRVIKTFTSFTRQSLGELAKYDSFAYLLDVPRGYAARSQVDPDWAVCAKKHGRIIVSGGLDSGNVREVIRRTRPYGVDVCSWTDRSPGVKDPDKIRAFIRAARWAVQDTERIKVTVR
ncbi:MAG: phosphoribosylanthranilate isomerase [Planctomycetes bacterium]|nr:phosphoribosylanthranilate isomerase [Planctomycetota bacterium]